ncbi:MAG: hypothetical protein PF503_08320 [Desulfobacula sp.]|jgi:hypothetical protein|nr:hypothetical protein [Desulfobacula sp.]
MKRLSETAILKRYSQPPGDPPEKPDKQPGGAISVFPNAPLDMPSETFNNAITRRDQNRKTLLKWIQGNLRPDIDYGRIHLVEQCRLAKAGRPHMCSEFSHWSTPMLFKSGAERIIGILGLSAHFPALKELELACIHRQEISEIILKCELRTQNGTVVAHGSGARHIRQDNWKLNTSIKMAAKSALIDAVIRVSSLSGVFIKTHQHALTKLGVYHKNSIPGMSDCNGDGLPGRSVCNSQPEKSITDKQKHLILNLAGRKGLTTESLEKVSRGLFNKDLEDLDRVEASRFIQHFNS